ncbi:MAG: hypothetical protein NC483_03100 [Ruminococcus sp.]|nr:hypothetical protein [Ruminococcus sp.]
MKKRHIIMIIILVLAFSITMSLKEEKDTKKLECTTKSTMYDMDSLTTLNAKIKNSEIVGMDIFIDITIPKEYESQKQNMINSISAEGKMEVTSTKDGIRLKTGIHSEYFKSLGLNTKTSYNELKEVLEFQGYTCK